MGGARPSRSCGAATPPSLLKTLPLKWGRVFQLKKRSIFFFSKKADEVGKGRRNRHRLCSGNRSSNCLSEKRSKGGREEKSRKGDNAQVSVGVKGTGTSDLGGPATKETVTGSTAARKEAVLSSSALGHSWLAASALSAAKAGGTGLGTARRWRSGTGSRSC